MKKQINTKVMFELMESRDAKEYYRDITKRSWYSDIDREKAQAEYETASAQYLDSLKPIEAELEAVQKRCNVRLITAEEIMDTLVEIHDLLGISKKAQNGVEIDVDLNAKTFPNAYKYIPQSTHFSAVYKSGSWRITDIYRDVTRGPKSRIIVTHTEDSKRAIIDRLTRIE